MKSKLLTLIERMWAGVNSKILQGTLFKIMRDKLMNCGVECEDDYWAEQLAAAKQPTTTKRPGALKNDKPVTGNHASAHGCVGQVGSLKDPGQGL